MNVTFFGMLVGLALLVPIIVALIIVLVRKPVVGLCILLGLGVLVMGGIFLIMPVRTAREVLTHEISNDATVAREQWRAQAATRVPGDGLDTAWEGDELPAPVYPSLAAAMKGMVTRFAPTIEDAMLNRPEAPSFRISMARSAPEGPALMMSMREALIGKFAGSRCETEGTAQTMPLEAPDQEIHIQLEIVRTYTRNPRPILREEFNPTLRATLIAPRISQRPSVTVSVEDKPWAANPRQFMDSDPGRWIVGRCRRPQSPEYRALKDAFEQAVDALMPTVRDAVRRQRTTWSASDDAWLRERLRAQVSGHPLCVDRFVQPLSLSSTQGTVWRSAVLIDASQRNITSVSNAAVTDLNVRDSRLKNTIFSAAGLALVIVLVYLLMNALTKGYYVWPLRVLAVVLLVGGLILLASLG